MAIFNSYAKLPEGICHNLNPKEVDTLFSVTALFEWSFTMFYLQ